MSLIHQQEPVDEDNVLVATLDSVKVLLQLLKAINFREGSSITDCSIRTMEPEQMLDFHTGSLNIINKVLLRSECLKEVFNELDPLAEYVEFILSPSTPYFRITTHSIGGDSRVDIPKDCEMIESFQCTSLTTAKYKLNHIKPSCKPLNMSQKVSISTDERGLLCFQYMIRIDNFNGYIEFYCSPIVDAYDD